MEKNVTAAHTDKDNQEFHEHHLVTYKMQYSTWVGLLLLTIMTVTVSVFGADIYTLSVLTALVIASTKAFVVALYFMHLKFDPKVYIIMIGIVMLLFIIFMVLTLIDYVTRPEVAIVN
jgi:cytochrome c oxidase subunit 4